MVLREARDIRNWIFLSVEVVGDMGTFDSAVCTRDAENNLFVYDRNGVSIGGVVLNMV